MCDLDEAQVAQGGGEVVDPDLFRGVEIDQVSVWRDPDGSVILQVFKPDAPQIRVSAAKWRQIVEFLAETDPEPE